VSRDDIARTIDAEARHVELGRRCRINPDGSIGVPSESQPGVWRTVIPWRTVNDLLVLRCDCPSGSRRSTPAGHAICSHQGGAAHSLAWRGLACFDGERWYVTEKAKRLATGTAHDAYVVTRAEGARSNFEARCPDCQFSVPVATLDRATAEQVAEGHRRQHEPRPAEADPFAGIPA
jgi:hypothetical protein